MKSLISELLVLVTMILSTCTITNSLDFVCCSVNKLWSTEDSWNPMSIRWLENLLN